MSALQTSDDILEEGLRLVREGERRGVPLRLMGGLAVRAHAGGGPLVIERAYKDIDLLTAKGKSRKVTELMEGLGYEANRMFNATNGHRRLLYYDRPRERQVDVFVGGFEMCHSLPLAERLETHATAIPLAELLLTKLQIVQLNAKDQADILTVLYHHDLGDGDAETIDAQRIAKLCAADWGLWRTVRMNVERSQEALGTAALTAEQRERVRGRLERLWARVDEEPKSTKWKLRDRVGDRVKWYEEPEEVD
jgi:hypothetical protein